MALRDKLKERVQTYWILIFKNGYRIVAVTDRSIVTFKAGGFMRSKPKSIVSRSPRAPIGPLSGMLWGKAIVGGEQLWISKRFFGDVSTANASVGA